MDLIDIYRAFITHTHTHTERERERERERYTKEYGKGQLILKGFLNATWKPTAVKYPFFIHLPILFHM